MPPSSSDMPSGASPASTDAFELLKHDHKKVQMLFNDFEAMRNASHADADARGRIVQQICTELTVHAQIEEEIFYPAVRQATDDDGLVDEAEQEHAGVKALIAQLQQMQPGDARFDATVLALSKAVMRHAQEEESEMFTEARGEIDAAALGQQLLQRKQALQQQAGEAARG